MEAMKHTEVKNRMFPVFLKLEELQVLLVGAGKVGLEKLHAMLVNAPGSRIEVVAEEVLVELDSFAAQYPHVRITRKRYDSNDLAGKDLVIVAVNNIDTAARIREDAKERGLMVNVADKPELCDFYLGSIVNKGNLKIAISTNGKSPTTAKRLREMLQEALPEEIDQTIDNLYEIRNSLNGNFGQKVKRLNEITRVLVENDRKKKELKWKRIASGSVIVFALMLTGHFIFSVIPFREIGTSVSDYYKTLDPNFHWMVLAGFLAQLVDGALGMGYGVTCTTILLSSGVSLPAISGSIHTAEIFASGASGYSHYRFGNVNKKLFKALVIPGVIGAIIGAWLLSTYGDSHTPYLRPILACYTMFLGVKILMNAFRKMNRPRKFKRYGLLAGTGGFLDSFGGGGWGPIVTTTLINRGRNPKYVIGSVSLTEFFVTLASALTFYSIRKLEDWQVIVALIIGGVIAAPFAARLTGKLPRKASFILLGILVIIWSARILTNIF